MAAQRKSRNEATRPAKRSSPAKKTREEKMMSDVTISFGPAICNDLTAAEQREWLVTNGIGGFASGTVAGSATRRYHGLLVAALNPPAGRTLLVGGLDELATLDGKTHPLATHRWASGAIAPEGHLSILKFQLDGKVAVWTYQLGNVLIEKRIWMRYGENTTFVQYTLVEAATVVALDLKALVNYRDFHSATHAGDWGRDTMIALPGLALSTGRADIARRILLAFSRFVDGGMLPNNFPDSGAAPEYNTMDATLWYFEAVRQYFAATQDSGTLKKLFPVLGKIIGAHVKGTRYNIHVDPTDGLLYGGGPGVQLTWMDAKVGDWVVTPRTGKPVEINALWVNALENMSHFAKNLGLSADAYEQLATKAKSSFVKFWNDQRNCCFDVIDSPGIGNDSALRPNQIFAVSLRVSLLSFEQQKAVVDACASQLLTPFGLRSLAPREGGYTGVYSGSPRQRDAAYHQGTVWGWLLGPFALAHYRVYKKRATALAFLEALAKSTDSYGLGTLAEIFDGDPPHLPQGCIAQAWTVGELLRAWKELSAQAK